MSNHQAVVTAHPQLTVLGALLLVGLGLRGVGLGLSWVFERYPKARPWVIGMVVVAVLVVFALAESV